MGASMGKTISETMFDRIAASEELPTIPGVALDVLAMAKRANVSLPDIADVVGRDPALAAKILRLANSSFFGVSAKTGTVTQALVRLGLRASLSVVLGFSILPKLARAGRQSTDMRLIWNMSLLSSVSAKVIEERTRGRFMEEAFTGALLQDLGMLAMVAAAPEHYVDVLKTVERDSAAEVHEVEEVMLGVNHMEIGVYLLGMWNVPDQIVGPIGGHHRPDTVRPSGYDDYRLARVLQASDAVSRLICYGPTHANVLRCVRLFADYFCWPPTFVVSFVRDLTPSIRQVAQLLSIEVSDDLMERLDRVTSLNSEDSDVWKEALRLTGAEATAGPDAETLQ